MTRETKLGFGIAGTFLTIAGSWVSVKLYRGEPAATEDPSAAVATEDTEPKPQGLVDAAAAAPAAKATTQPVATAAPAAETPAPVAIKPDTDAVVQSTTTSPPAPVMSASVFPTPATNDPPPPVVPTPMGDPMQPIVAPVTPTPAPVGDPMQPIAAPTSPTPAPEQPAPATLPIPTPATPGPAIEPPPVAAAIPQPVVEAKKDPEPPPSTTVIAKPADTPPSAPTPPAAPGEPSVVLVPASPAGTASLGPPGGATNPPREPFSTANNARPTAEPRAQSYLEEEYRWQPGDGFAMLSQKFYFSDKYAAALQQYNRDYPLAGLSLKQNPPSIVPGQVIWVPPVRILERDYPTLIAGVQPLTERGMPATNAIRPVESNVAANAPQLYRVRERGETMYEIARRTLNDSGQWFAVYRLNPTLNRDPKLLISADTVLRLPAEAKLEAADRP